MSNTNTAEKKNWWYNNPAGWRKPITLIDGYKVGHIHQYPDGTEIIVSNLTARSTRREYTDHVVYAGAQYFIKEYLIALWNKEFFQRDIEEVVAEFTRRINNYIPGNNVGEAHVRALHKLGYLPIIIMSLPEGTEYPIKVPAMMIWNTVKDFFWVTNYLETILSTTLWGTCTSATTAHQYKKLLTRYAMDTVGNADFVPWQGHDFSFRGMFGLEAAAMSGIGHLFSFFGTDTIPAIDFAEWYYNADCTKEIIGGSVAATEHSVACSTILDFVRKVRIEITKQGKTVIPDELMDLADIEYVRHLITKVYPTGIVSIVADSFDYWNTITNTARILKDLILSRDGKVVFRPDTGDPVRVVVGDFIPDYSGASSLEEAAEEAADSAVEIEADDTAHGERGADRVTETFQYLNKFYKVTVDIEWNRWDKRFYFVDGHNVVSTEEVEITPEQKGSIQCLWDIFGGTVTEKGYNLLDSHVGLIYGDSITLARAGEICEGLKTKNFASINIVFGIGSFTYQYNTRDTDGYAVKATWAQINGEACEIYKAPKGAEFKKSAFGLTAVFKNAEGEFYLKDKATWDEVLNCEFVKVFEDGKIVKDYTLQEVRDNLAKYL